MVSTANTGIHLGTALVLTDGWPDIPDFDGPRTYSLSSGEDYVFTFHMGQAIDMYQSGTSGLFFDGENGYEKNEDGSAKYTLLFRTEDIREDETYIIPAEVIREGAERGFN